MISLIHNRTKSASTTSGRSFPGSQLNVSEIARAYRRRYGHAPVEEIAHGLVLRKSRLKPKHGAENRNPDPLHRTS